MHVIKATVREGRLDVPVPAEWPDGMEVEIHPAGLDPDADRDAPLTPEDIAKTLQAMDEMEPLEFTEPEVRQIEEERQRRKEWEKAHFHENAEKIARVWE